MDRICRAIAAALAVLVCVNCVSSGKTAPLGVRHFETGGGYSICPPESWQPTDFPGLKYKAMIGPSENNFSPNITFVDENFNGSLQDYVDANITILKKVFVDFAVIQRDSFTTKNNIAGERIIIQTLQYGQQFRQILYFIPNTGEKKISVMASVALNLGEKYDRIFDASLKTFEWSN